ncbi:MAG: Rrf2 family transcriptional regulator [Candidatus Margulisiibacteriota bacterium]
MKMSTKGRYGTRLMLDIAINGGQGPVLIRHISKRLELSKKYLGQLALMLKNAGLLRSVRGAKGGYLLSKPKEELTLYDIVECLEGPMSLSDQIDNCAANVIWEEISHAMENRMRAVTLASLAETQNNISQKFAYTI